MPLLSAFTPCGMLELSSRDPSGFNFYKGLIDAYGPAYDPTPESESGIPNHFEAKVFATAMSLARANNALVRAGNQYNAQTAWDCLLDQCKDWGVIPAPNDTIASLQSKCTAKQLQAQGARFSAIANGLRGILGSDFIAYRPITAADNFTVYPAWPSAAALQKANPVLPTTQVKYCKLVDPVGLTGAPVTVAYTNLDPTAAEVILAPGDVVMVQPDTETLAEKVSVTSSDVTPVATWAASTAYAFGALVVPTTSSGFYYECIVSGTSGSSAPTFPTSPTTLASLVTPGAPASNSIVVDGSVTWLCVGPLPTPRTFTATFANGHDAGATVSTMSWPYQWSTKLFSFIVVSATAAIDAETRRQVNAFMQQSAREVATWAIVQPTSSTFVGGVLGPFTTDASPIGCVPLGVLDYVPSP